MLHFWICYIFPQPPPTHPPAFQPPTNRSPASGRIYRHGPALLAAAKDNREMPAVKLVFEAFAAHGGFAGAPPPGYAAAVAGAAGAVSPARTAAVAAQRAMAATAAAAAAAASAAAGGSAPGSPSASAAAAAAAPAPAPAPGAGRRLGAAPGHGSITQLVTRELQS